MTLNSLRISMNADHRLTLNVAISLAMLCLIAAIAARPGHGSSDASETGQSCTLFDELYFYDKPADLPLTPIHTAYTWDIWGKGPPADDVPPLDFINSGYKQVVLDGESPDLIAINIEHWVSYNVSSRVLDETNRKHLAVLRAFRDVFPDATIGYYNKGFHPTHGGLDKRAARTSVLRDWRQTNDGVQPLIDEVDAVFPSLYTNSADVTFEGWLRKAKVYMEEARRIADGKPIYPYISPFLILDYPTPIPTEMWRQQLEFLSRNADGAVIWTHRGRSKRTDWDEDAAWWQETLAFIDACQSE